MTASGRTRLEPVLIGPPGSGKSAVARALASRLKVPHVEADDVTPQVDASVFSPEEFRLIDQREGWIASYIYWERSFPTLLQQLFVTHKDCVFDLGGGHTSLLGTEQREQIKLLLEPFRTVILLLPAEDPNECLAVLRQRLSNDADRPVETWQHDGVDLLRHWVTDDQFRCLATHTVLTGDLLPDQIAEQLVAVVGPRSSG